jgi:XisH protein
MPAKDRYHDTIKRALAKDGWTITGEHVKIGIENRALYIDIQAVGASIGLVVLIEVKELEDVLSPIEALANAYGKYGLYRLALDHAGSDIPLYLAVTQAAYQGILSEKIGKLAIGGAHIALMVFDPEREEMVEWIP